MDATLLNLGYGNLVVASRVVAIVLKYRERQLSIQGILRDRVKVVDPVRKESHEIYAVVLVFFAELI